MADRKQALPGRSGQAGSLKTLELRIGPTLMARFSNRERGLQAPQPEQPLLQLCQESTMSASALSVLWRSLADQYASASSGIQERKNQSATRYEPVSRSTSCGNTAPAFCVLPQPALGPPGRLPFHSQLCVGRSRFQWFALEEG